MKHVIHNLSVVVLGLGFLIVPSLLYAYGEGNYYSEGYYYSQSYYEGFYYSQGSYSSNAKSCDQTFSTPGPGTFTVPAGVTSLRVVAVGGGGGGGAGAGGWGSGGGGGCSGAVVGNTLTVTPGQAIPVYVGYGGAGGNGAGQCTISGFPWCGSYNPSTNGSTGGDSGFGSIVAHGGSWGRTGFYNLFNQYPGGSGGGSGGGGGGNGWPGFYAQAGNGGMAGGQTNSQGAGGYCTGGGWGWNGTSLIKQVPYAAGQGGTVGGGYYGGGGGGGLILNGSSIKGGDGQSSPGNGGVGYGAGGGGSNLDNTGVGGSGAQGIVYVEWDPSSSGSCSAPPPPPPPTAQCSITFDKNPINFGDGTTIHWTSNGGDLYINNIGYVNATGTAVVQPATTTDYSGVVSSSTSLAFAPSQRGKVAGAGSQSYITPGTYQFTIPNYTGTLTATVNGAGGAGGWGGCGVDSGGSNQCLYGAGQGVASGSGESSSFGSAMAGGGGNGAEGGRGITSDPCNGGPGADGNPGTGTVSGGGALGGGGGDGYTGGWCNGGKGGTGGSGGKTTQTFTTSTLAPGSTVTVVVGAGGIGWVGYCNQTCAGSGQNGSVSISWTDASNPPPPTCSNGLNISQYPSCSCPSGQSQSGSTCVAPAAPKVVATCPVTLTVNKPTTPTAHISADFTKLTVGETTGIHADFSAGSGDAIAEDNIDSPEGTGLGATTNPDSRKDITFTASTTGTYTFYARMRTANFPEWKSYDSVTITVSPSAECNTNNDCATDEICSTSSMCEFLDCGVDTNMHAENHECVCDANYALGSDNICHLECIDAFICANADGTPDPGGTYSAHQDTSCTLGAPQLCQYGCLNGICESPTPAFTFRIVPSAVVKGNTTTIIWNATHVSSCTLTGDNTDAWSCDDTASCTTLHTVTTAPIQGKTTYTLSCLPLAGQPAIPDQKKAVTVTPTHSEH